tara:strand:- start:263 stop:877 length:615 start_codon:yes stop_codon:yes gene_type:complete
MAPNITDSAKIRVHKVKIMAIGCALLVAIFISGLQYFVLNLPRHMKSPIRQSDGIVVITGGQQRLDAGLTLLATGTASKLLISGVGAGLSKAILANDLQLDQTQRDLLICCAELEFAARDTRGNARAARHWAETNKLASLYLVTANYHMPRAKLAFEREMPHIDLHYWPISPDDLRIDSWWTDPGLIRLLAREYAKFLAEFIRL